MARNYSKEEFSSLIEIGNGYESKVLKDNDIVIKSFIIPNGYNLEKQTKLRILGSYNFPFLTNRVDNVTVDGTLKGYSMEYFESLPIDKMGYSYNKKVAVLKTVKEYLEELHEYGVVVCDLKVSNILASPKGDIKICDNDGFKVDDYYPEFINMVAKKYINRNKKYDDNLDIYGFNFITAYFLLGFSPDEVFDALYNEGSRKYSDRKQLIYRLVNNPIFEQRYIIDDKELQKETKIII